MITQAPQRANQRSARSLASGFNGNISIVLLALPFESDLNFTANVTYETGDVENPTATFSPCDDLGRVRRFGDVDDVIRWLNGAFFDILNIEMEIADATVINRKFSPPSDAVRDATTRRTQFMRYLDGINDRVAQIEAKVAAEILAGWAEPTAHAVLQANHAETNKQLETVTEIRAFYVAEIARYEAIINLAG